MQNLESRDLREIFETQSHNSLHLSKFDKIENSYSDYPVNLLDIDKERINKHSLHLDVFVKVLSSIYIDEIDIANFSRACIWFQ